MKCLEKDLTRRYATANGLALDLRRHLDCEPVLARTPSQFYRFRKLARRNKVVFVAVAGVAASLLLGLVVSTWQAVRATCARASEAVQHKLADLQMALQAWEEGDLQRANDLIEDSRPTPDQVPSFVRTVTFARDGRWLASVGSDYSVKLWDVETGNPTPVRTVHRYASWAGSGSHPEAGTVW